MSVSILSTKCTFSNNHLSPFGHLPSPLLHIRDTEPRSPENVVLFPCTPLFGLNCREVYLNREGFLGSWVLNMQGVKVHYLASSTGRARPKPWTGGNEWVLAVQLCLSSCFLWLLAYDTPVNRRLHIGFVSRAARKRTKAFYSPWQQPNVFLVFAVITSPLSRLD